MKYDKPALTLEQQADRLISRGLAGDRELIRQRLSSVNYYRLSGYLYPFRNPDDTFRPGTTFEAVWQRYAFDRHLRLLVMDAIERIEIAVRAQLAYHHAHLHGPFDYATDANSLPKLDAQDYADFLERITNETSWSKERFVTHFKQKYGDSHECLPVWMVIEIMSFGSVLTFYRGASHQVKKAVANAFGMPDTVFDSWLLTLNTARNICAHHGRLWNRENGVKPIIPRIDNYPEWHTPVKVDNRRVFAILTICRYCLIRVAPQSRWDERLRQFIHQNPGIPIAEMGFPRNWEQSPLWQEAQHG
jgi:abortive infection bacteriophage resistance protein